ncbi:MAG: ferritin-like domain-containing protein [Bifidobacteriaceae bacterium]|jgi:hypothetical protein|nr:ferritin-like domain-containing protein [Bifidobacteriaceae bacterium]
MTRRSRFRAQAWAAVAVAAGLVLSLAGCDRPALRAVEGQREWDPAVLSQVMGQLGDQAAACVGAPSAAAPYRVEGLTLVAEGVPVWLEALGLPASSGEADTATVPDAVCQPDVLTAALDRTRQLLDWAGETGNYDRWTWGAVNRGLDMAWLLATSQPVELAGLAGPGGLAEAPGVEGLDDLGTEVLWDLALAEDQAGFVAEYLAVGVVDDDELRSLVRQVAQFHRERAAALVVASLNQGGGDPRQGAYVLPDTPADAAAVRLAIRELETALATHYGAVPYPSDVDQVLYWQLRWAHAWGEPIPALPSWW